MRTGGRDIEPRQRKTSAPSTHWRNSKVLLTCQPRQGQGHLQQRQGQTHRNHHLPVGKEATHRMEIHMAIVLTNLNPRNHQLILKGWTRKRDMEESGRTPKVRTRARTNPTKENGRGNQSQGGWVWYNSYKRIGITSLKKTSESRAVNLTFQSFKWYELVVTQFMIHMRISVIFCEPSRYRANVS